MPDPGEELVGEYLKHILGCEFVEYNLMTPDVQGEIDVIGIDVDKRKLFVCEVATHLQGLQYTKRRNGKTGPDNVDRFIKKFGKNIPYAEKYFADYDTRFMIWSPVVRIAGPNAQHNPMADLQEVVTTMEQQTGYRIEPIVNENYQRCLDELREFARNETKELKSPIMRMIQIQEHLDKHLQKLGKRSTADPRSQ